jgi:hydroxyacid-oxoacid transhydrogenase
MSIYYLPRLGRDTSLPDDAVGDFLFEHIARFLDNLGVPRGLKAVGYQNSDIEMLVKGTIPQRRVLDLAPGIGKLTQADLGIGCL